MRITMVDLAKARDAASKLLDELGLEAYLFEVEPGDEKWQVKVECAIDGGWERILFEVDKEILLAGFEDASVRRQLLETWRSRFAECKCLSK